MQKKLTVFFITFLVCLQSGAVPLSGSARISLLTNSPWNGAVYAVFGHTAIRVQDEPNNIDYAFNYGVFDFDAPNFMFRFVKGETDYILAVQDYDRYLFEYQMRGITTYEQVLNLTQEEKQNLWDALVVNSLPENREYRYNFLFDNCSTRPRDRIEDAINGTIKYQETGREQTFRDLLHECIGTYPWLQFGIDLIIGSDADRLATDREKMFLPLYLKNAFDNAVVMSTDGTKRQLVSAENLVTKERIGNVSHIPINYPLISGFILLAVTLLLSVLSCKKRINAIKIFDILLFAVAGVGGCIVAFLVFFSEHPAVSPNWNIVWLNPIQLIVAILIPIKKLSKVIYYYHFINFALLSLFLLCWFFIPQQLEIAFIPYILSIWVRSGTNFVAYKQTNKRKLNSTK